MAITRIPNHADLAVARLVTQFKGSDSHAALLRAWARQVQELEDAFLALLATIVINTSTADQLDRVGAVIGCPRGSLEDVPYRAFLRAQILANKSSGTTEELIAVLRAILLAYNGNSIVSKRWFPGSLALEAQGDLGDAPTAAIARMLNIARAAGVRLFFEWEPDTTTIRLGISPALGTGTLAGVKGT